MDIIKSEFLRLDLRDVGRGVATAVFSAVVLALYQAVADGGFSAINWAGLLQVGTVAGLGYLVKNFFSDDTGKLGGML